MIPEWLSLIDVAYVAIAILFAMGGFQKGFAGQVAHIATFVALGLLLFFAYPPIFNYLAHLFRNLEKTYMMWLILAGVVGLVVGFFLIINKLLAKILKTQISDRSDHVYGAFLGFIRGALLALFLMIFFVLLGPPKIYDTCRKKSQVGIFVCYELVPRIQPHLTRSVLEKRVNKIRDALLHQEEAGVIDI